MCEAAPGELKVHGFVSKPEIQKLNRNSIFVFVNGRLIRDISARDMHRKERAIYDNAD